MDPGIDGTAARSAHQATNTRPDGFGTGPQLHSTSDFLAVRCGPLLNYRRMSGEHTNNPIWHGSVLVVTAPGQIPPQLGLRGVQGVGATSGANGQTTSRGQSFSGVKLYEDPKKAFWRYEIDLPFQERESVWEYLIPNMRSMSGQINLGKPRRFYVPSKHESMRIMFHSCNGFSVGTDEDAWSGPAVWNDVLRMHDEQPFHVMIGGGDQIYNDSIRIRGPLKEWTEIANPKKRRHFPFGEELRAKCDEYYYTNYVEWFSTEPFASANGCIPQLNIWDDHDIIDGFGSYTDHFMRAPVFRGIGSVAHKYYMLFQHHLPPPPSTFTTDSPQTMHRDSKTVPLDPVQLQDTFVMKPTSEDPSYIVGDKAGPYVEEKSQSIYCQLGKRIAFLGLDGRTERTRHQVTYPETYDKIFNHLSQKLGESNGEIKHLIMLLGIPVAYPRLQWLENILHSPIIGPLKFLNKRFGFAGGFFNTFDGGVDLLDDLDDHYTAHQHKAERKDLVSRLQHLSKERGVRITIVSGDVHLAAMGRFYSNPSLQIPAEADWRYMSNVVSSAITNKPPPQAVANLLARRNKIHHLDSETDETLLEIFDKNPGVGEPGVKPKSATNNHATMPSRNYAIIRETHGHTGDAAARAANNINGTAADTSNSTAFQPSKNPREPLHKGEVTAGTQHPAAQGTNRTGIGGPDGLDITFRVEINPGDKNGRTEGYGFSVPALHLDGYKQRGEKW